MSIITISRGSYSGAKAVAEKLGEQLGFPVLSREHLLQAAAKEFNISESELAASFVNPPSAWQQTLGRRVAFVKCVTSTLLDCANGGNLIYHGHVGHLLLGDIPHVLRVRVISSMEKRIEAASQQLQIGRDQAIAHIQHVDKERSRWAKCVYGVSWDTPEQYHALLNLEFLSVETACAAIGTLVQQPEFQRTEAAARALDDATLACRVWAAIAKDPQTRDAGLEVNATAGTVTITGNVGSSKTGDLITQAAKRVEGVKEVVCEVGMGQNWYW